MKTLRMMELCTIFCMKQKIKFFVDEKKTQKTRLLFRFFIKKRHVVLFLNRSLIFIFPGIWDYLLHGEKDLMDPDS